MKARSASVLAFASAMTVACSVQPKATTKTATVPKCIPEAVSADTCEYFGPQDNPNRAVCRVYVGGTKDAPVVYPYDVFVSKGVRNNVTIVWSLLDPGATFRNNNDGPDFGNNSEFSHGGTTNDPNGGGNPHGQPDKHYQIKFKNTANGRSHPYTITFKPATADAVTCDPTITNGGA